MTDRERERVLAEVIEWSDLEMRRLGDFTLGEYLDGVEQKTGGQIGRHLGKRQLTALVEAGKLQTGQRYDQRIRRTIRVWWKAKPASEAKAGSEAG